MKLIVTFTGMAPGSEAKTRNRAIALLMEMEREFAQLKVEIVSDAKAQPPSSKAGEDSGVARITGKAPAGESKRGKAADSGRAKKGGSVKQP